MNNKTVETNKGERCENWTLRKEQDLHLRLKQQKNNQLRNTQTLS